MIFGMAFERLILKEGGYSDHRSDAGSKTKYGITEAVARAGGYAGDMRDLPLSKAKEIAKAPYWDTLRLDAIANLSPAIAEEVFDTSYNMGIGVAGRFLQRALNVLNRGATDYPDVVVDSVVGPLTVAALESFLNRRGREGEIVLLRALNAQQGERYISIAEGRLENESFVYGWFNNRVTI